MLESIYGWLQSLAAYLVIAAAVTHAIPGKEYEKYVRFFTGLVLVLLLATPILKLTGMEGEFHRLYSSREAQAQRREIEEAEKIYGEANLFDFLPDEYTVANEEAGSTTHNEDTETGAGNMANDRASRNQTDNPTISVDEIEEVEEIRVGR